MSTRSEIVGWLLLDDAARVLVREENGQVSAQAMPSDDSYPEAIQTGSFNRGELALLLERELALGS